MESISVVTLTDKELSKHLEAATTKLLSFTWRARRKTEVQCPEATVAVGGRRFSYRPLQNLEGAISAVDLISCPPPSSTFSIAQLIQDINGKDDLYTDAEHHVLRTLRRGIQVYLEICKSYSQASGLDRLKAANKPRRVGDLRARDLIQPTATHPCTPGRTRRRR